MGILKAFAVAICLIALPLAVRAEGPPERPAPAPSGVLKVAFSENYAPLSWGAGEQLQGILADLLRATLEQRLNQTVAYEGFPWTRAQKMVRDGLADAFVTVPTAARREYTTCSELPVITVEVALYTYSGHPRTLDLLQVKTYDDLADFVIVEYAGNGWAKEKFKNLKVEWARTLENTYAMLAKHHGDVLVRNRFNFDYFSRHLDLKGKIVRLPVKLSSVDFHLCVRTGSPFAGLLTDFDQALRDLNASDEREEIYARYRH